MYDTSTISRAYLRRPLRARSALSLVLCALGALGWAATAFGGEPPCPDLEECPCILEMVERVRDRGWVGINMEMDEKGWTLSGIVPGGPADRAGLRTGDRLLRMQGVPYDRKHEKELQQVYKELKPGTDLVYTIDRRGKELEVTVHLAPLPPKMIALWVGEMVLESYAESTGRPAGRYEPAKDDGEEGLDENGADRTRRGNGGAGGG